jgi:hypothetical protein
MARRTFKVSSWTPVAVADAVNFTNQGYMGLMGGSTTQVIKIRELYMGGVDTSSKPALMVLSRDSTVQATPTALTTGESDAALDPATAALAAPPVAFTQSTTKPQRSASLGLMALGFNAYGGVVLWQAGPGGEIGMLGNTASFGEISLSAFTGGTPGLMNSHISYEPL